MFLHRRHWPCPDRTILLLGFQFHRRRYSQGMRHSFISQRYHNQRSLKEYQLHLLRFILIWGVFQPRLSLLCFRRKMMIRGHGHLIRLPRPFLSNHHLFR